MCACGKGAGAVLMHNNWPIAFFNQVLKIRFLSLYTYEKESLALVAAVKKWHPYFLGHSFRIRTGHQSLKFLLEQNIGILMQQKWISKLLCYDFLIEYKNGREDGVADALSCRDDDSNQKFI